MSAGITVNEFKHIPGENDAEYIKLLKDALRREQQIVSKSIAKIKELSAQLEQKWVSVSERLPDEYGNYIADTKSGGIEECTYYPEKNRWSTCEADGITYLSESDVIAWMPLPEPYRGETE